MIRNCYGEKPVVYEVTGGSQAELWRQIAEIAETADDEGTVLNVGSSWVEETNGVLEWTATVYA